MHAPKWIRNSRQEEYIIVTKASVLSIVIFLIRIVASSHFGLDWDSPNAAINWTMNGRKLLIDSSQIETNLTCRIESTIQSLDHSLLRFELFGLIHRKVRWSWSMNILTINKEDVIFTY